MTQSPDIDVGHSHAGVVPGRCVRLSGEVAHVTVPRPGGGPEPRVELIREGDVVQAIEITCGCGQRIRVRCVYPK
jgi:hypothetical protein